jgi:hypothetical protein
MMSKANTYKWSLLYLVLYVPLSYAVPLLLPLFTAALGVIGFALAAFISYALILLFVCALAVFIFESYSGSKFDAPTWLVAVTGLILLVPQLLQTLYGLMNCTDHWDSQGCLQVSNLSIPFFQYLFMAEIIFFVSIILVTRARSKILST